MIVIANWKAYVDSKTKAEKLFTTAKRLTSAKDTEIEIVLAPPAPYLGLLSPGNRSKVRFAVQNISLSVGGAATGEVTAALLHDLGVEYAIIGHSERRAMGETDEMVVEKVKLAFANKITPIVCIGESSRDGDAKYLTFLRAQIHAVFSVLSPKERAQVILAYEPIWAIGKTANEAITPADLTEMMLYIRKVLGAYIPGKGAEKVQVIYGGSVEPANARSLAEETGIDGFLAGHASAESDSFSAIVKAARDAAK
jgi:triosephosphate isomerase